LITETYVRIHNENGSWFAAEWFQAGTQVSVMWYERPMTKCIYCTLDTWDMLFTESENRVF